MATDRHTRADRPEKSPTAGDPREPSTAAPARPVDAPPDPTAPTPAPTPGDAPDAPTDDAHTRPTVVPGEGPPPRLDLADHAAVRRWLDDVAARVDDLAAAASDQTAPIAERTLGRARARDLIHDAHGTLRDLIALARAGLPAVGGAP
jgi:hypothetical protein